MPITTLDPMTALIVIDLQQGILASPKVHPVKAVVANAVQVIKKFRDKNLPIILVNVAGGARAEMNRFQVLGSFQKIGPT